MHPLHDAQKIKVCLETRAVHFWYIIQKMKILVAGYGYLGGALGKSLISKKNEVWGLSRRHSVNVPDVKLITVDLTKPETLLQLPSIDHAVLCQAPSKSDNYYDTYVAGTRNLIQAIAGKLSGKLIFISSTRVYGRSQGEGGTWIDESIEPKPDDEDARSLLEAEQIVRKASGIVFRLGGIYGSGRNRIRQIRSGELVPEFSDTYVNRIHIEDVVQGIELLLIKGRPGEVYLGVDDRPTTQNEFYTWLFERLSLQKSPPSAKAVAHSHGPSNKRCSNGKLKKLSFQLKYPTYQEGYSTLIS